MKSSDIVVGVLGGLAVGAVLGVLFAPDKGSKTREKIKDGYDDVKDNLLHKLQKASKGIKDKFSHAKYDLEETYEDLISNMNHKSEDVISFLETKLADLKEQNAKLQN